MKNKLLSLAVCMTIIFTNISVFAIKEEKNEPESDKLVFADDFESYASETAITSIKGSDGMSDSKDIVAFKDASEGAKNDTVYAEIKNGAKLGAVFNGGVSVKSGKLVVEFDGNLVAGNLWFSLLYSGSLGTRAKWFAASDTVGLCTITKTVAVPGTSAEGYQRFKDSEDNDILFKQNDWAHYKFEIDMDKGAVTAHMDDTVGQTVTGYTYIKDNDIAGIGIYNASQASRYIDNLKVYIETDKKTTYTTYIYRDDMEGYVDGEEIENKRDENAIGASYGYWSSNPDSNLMDFKAVKKGEALCKKATDASKIETEIPEDSENIVAEIGNKTAVQYDLPYAVSDGIICVSLDMLTGNGGFGIGIRQQGDSGLNAKCPMWVYRNAVRTVYFKPGETSYSTTDTSRYYYSSMTMYKSYQWFNAKLYINAKSGDCWMDINGNVSEVKNLDYIGTENTTANAVNEPITAIVFYNSRALNVFDDKAYIDNLEITNVSSGNSVVETVNGVDKIRVEFKDSLNPVTVGSANVKVKKDGSEVNVSDIRVFESNPKYVIIEFDEPLQSGDVYNLELSDGIKYADGNSIVSGTCNAEIRETAFELNAELTDVNYEASRDISAKFTLNSTELKNRSLNFILASYKDDRLVCTKPIAVNLNDGFYGSKTITVKCTLAEEADTLKAFVWADNLVPLAVKANESIYSD